MYALRFLRGGASREVGRLVSISLPFGIVRTNLSRADRDPSCWLEEQVEVVGIRRVFARSADAASVSRAMRDLLPNCILVATSLAWQAAERLETPKHRGDGRGLLSGELQGRSLINGASPSARARRQSRAPGSGVGPAACLDGSVSRRADLYGSSPIDGGDKHRSGNVEMAGRSMHQEVVRVSRREARRGSWHLNTVNQRHMTMKRWLNHQSPPRGLYTLPEPLHALVDAIGIQA